MSAVRNIEFAQYNVTNIHPLIVAFMLCAGLIAILPRRHTVVLASLMVCLLVPLEQRLVIGGADFSMLRLFMLVAWLRILVRREHKGFHFCRLDRLILLWVFSASLFYVIRVGSEGLATRAGFAFDSLSAYFLIRFLVRTGTEVFLLWRHVAWIVLFLTPFMLYEATARYNFFGMFGYAGFDLVDVRDGTVRAQGPFSHPILAGTFGAVVVPVFFGLFWGRKRERVLFGSAIVGATIIMVTAGSGGPIIAWAFGFLGWALWWFRAHTRKLIWTVVALGAVLHFVREQPIWHLIGRMSSLTGGTGWHRFRLIDAFIHHFDEWVLIGTDSTAQWGWGLQDLTNQFIAEGVQGGLVTLVFFVAILVTSFRQLRRGRMAHERVRGPRSIFALLSWGTSVSLASHCVSFISVSYFGQMLPFFVFFVATVPALGPAASVVKRPKSAEDSKEAPRSMPVPRTVPAARPRPG